MANCRFTSIVRPCGYVPEGVTEVSLIDFEDFRGYVLNDFLVESVGYVGTAAVLDTSDPLAQYTGSVAGKLYTHEIELTLQGIKGETLDKLHTASRRPQVVVFNTAEGRSFTFGSQAGATVTYSPVTEGGAAIQVAIRATEHVQLYEVIAPSDQSLPFTYIPVFDDFASCEINGATDVMTGFLQAGYALKVAKLTGIPLDVNNVPTIISGLPQAARTLNGGPVPGGYVQQGSFAARAILDGKFTVKYAPDQCAEGEVSPWVLDSGFWDYHANWLDDGIWNF